MRNVLVGLGVGVALGMFIAPDSGSNLRRQLRERTRNLVPASGQNTFLGILNSAPREDLVAVYGVGTVIADQIVQNRPYTSEQQVIERNVVPESNFDHLKRQLQQKRTA